MDVERTNVELRERAAEPLGVLMLTLAATAVAVGLAVASAWITI